MEQKSTYRWRARWYRQPTATVQATLSWGRLRGARTDRRFLDLGGLVTLFVPDWRHIQDDVRPIVVVFQRRQDAATRPLLVRILRIHIVLYGRLDAILAIPVDGNPTT